MKKKEQAQINIDLFLNILNHTDLIRLGAQQVVSNLTPEAEETLKVIERKCDEASTSIDLLVKGENPNTSEHDQLVRATALLRKVNDIMNYPMTLAQLNDLNEEISQFLYS